MQGRRGDEITLLVDSEWDSYLRLYDEDGTLLIQNDDISPSNTRAQIEDYRLPETGLYQIEVSGYGRAAGRYVLVISTGEDTSAPTPTEEVSVAQQATAIAEAIAGDTLPAEAGRNPGRIDTGGMQTWTYAGQAGDEITLLVDSTWDSYLRLYDEAGTLLIEADDITAADTRAQIEDYRLPETGTYRIEVSGYGRAAGRYELVITSDGASSSAAPTPTPASPDEAVRPAFSGESETYRGPNYTIEYPAVLVDPVPALRFRNTDEGILYATRRGIVMARRGEGTRLESYRNEWALELLILPMEFDGQFPTSLDAMMAFEQTFQVDYRGAVLTDPQQARLLVGDAETDIAWRDVEGRGVRLIVSVMDETHIAIGYLYTHIDESDTHFEDVQAMFASIDPR